MFLNHADEYVQIEVNPRGIYNVNFFSGRNHIVLNSLPLFPENVISNNTCPINETLPSCASYCNNFWTGTVTLPEDYMPINVTKWA